MSEPPAGPNAWRDFRLLWLGQSTSLFGDQFLKFVLPVLGVQLLGVSESRAMLLSFALSLPFLIIGLPAGVIVDRLPRRITMIVCDGVQALIYALAAVLAFSGALTFPVMMAFMGLAGSALVFFQIGATSIVPEMFERRRDLQKANARIFFSESTMQTVGPMAAGPVIAAFGLVAALALNAATFLVSLGSLLFIRAGSQRTANAEGKAADQHIVQGIREGLSFVLRHPRIEPVVSCGIIYVLFARMISVSLVLYCIEILGLDAPIAGIVVGIAAAGFPLGNLLSPQVLNRFGSARTLALGAVVAVFGLVMLPASGAIGNVFALIAASFINGVGEGVFGPTALTLRQTDTPAHLLGRMNAVQRFLMWGAIPFGSLLAAILTDFIGLLGVMWIGGLGAGLCLPVLLRRDIRKEVQSPAEAVLAANHSEKQTS